MATLRIGELAARAGVSVEAVRFYEREGLLEKAPRGASGYRRFGEGAVARLAFIQRAKDLGFTLREVKSLLELWGDPAATRADVRGWAAAKVAAIEAEVAELVRKADVLKRLCAACRGDGPARGCPILTTIAGDGVGQPTDGPGSVSSPPTGGGA